MFYLEILTCILYIFVKLKKTAVLIEHPEFDEEPCFKATYNSDFETTGVFVFIQRNTNKTTNKSFLEGNIIFL